MAEEIKTIEANPEQGILGGLANIKILDIPLGAAATGAVTAGLFDALVGIVQGIVPQVPSWALKGLGSWAALRYGPKFMGNTPSQVAGLLLAYDAVQEFVNLRQSVANILSGTIGPIIKRSPAVATGPGATKPFTKDVTPSAGETASAYLARMGMG